MAILNCENYEISVQDFLMEKRICTVDLKFQTEAEFEEFISVYEDHRFGKGNFSFKIGEHCFDGWFGALIYDRAYNARVHICVSDERSPVPVRDKTYSIEKSLVGIASAIRDLCEMLRESEALSQEQRDKIVSGLNTPETVTEFESLVDDLPQYLKDNQETMEELKRRGCGAWI